MAHPLLHAWPHTLALGLVLTPGKGRVGRRGEGRGETPTLRLGASANGKRLRGLIGGGKSGWGRVPPQLHLARW